MRLVCGIVTANGHYDTVRPAGEGWQYRCAECSKVKRGEEMAADLDGEPFRAYYCQPCTEILAAQIIS